MRLARVHEELGRHAQLPQRHVQFNRLRARHARIALHDMDHRGRPGIHDVLERGLVPVRVEVVVGQLAAKVFLAVALPVALRVHRDPVRGAGAGADRLEAVRVHENPVGPVSPCTPPVGAHPVAVGDPLGNEVVHSRHDVVVALRKVDPVDVFEVLAVAGRAAVVRAQHHVACPGVDLDGGAEVVDDGGRRSAVDLDDGRVALSFLVSHGKNQDAPHLLSVGGRPGDLLLVPQREVAHLRVHVGQLTPGGPI